jgi:xylulokinase
MVKALLEGIGFNLRWTLENFKQDFNFDVNVIRAIGGGSVNDQWMQGISNITGKTIETITEPKMAGTIGVAMCAFVGAGIFKDFSEMSQLIHRAKVFNPQQEKKPVFDTLFATYKSIYYSFKKAYKHINHKRFNK